MKKRLERRRFTLAALFAVCILALAAANPSSAEAASKPKQVKNVKVVKTTAHTMKIKFDKVEDAEYYQIRLIEPYNERIYTLVDGQEVFSGYKEKLIYEGNTKKTSFTFKNLEQDTVFDVQVRACKNGKHGKMSEEAWGRTEKVPANEDGSVEQVKNVKVVKTTEGTVKVKFKKVKGAEHYQILIFQAEIGCSEEHKKILKTPLVYAPKTKKTTYTIKHLIGDTPYYVQVRAYKSGKYGKMSKKAKCRTKGVEDLQYVCASCGVELPYYEGSDPDKDYTHYAAMHTEAVHEVYEELHAGGMLY